MRRCARYALIIGGVGVAVRIGALALGIPPTDADEATTGLVARHIVAGREAPLYFYGQWYMGALEAYLAAPLFALFGSSTTAMRLPNLVWYVLLLWTMYHLTARLYSRRLGVVVVALLALGSDRVLLNQLRAGGGYPEIVPMAAGLMLGAVLLATDAAADRAGGRAGWRSIAGFAGWGMLAGLAVWDDLLVLPVVGVAGLLLVIFGWRRLLGPAGPALIGGGLLGAAPLLWVNYTEQTDSWEQLALLRRSGAAEAAVYPLVEHLRGGVLQSIPMATGLCPPDRCTAAQLWWGPVYLVLLAVAGWWAIVALARYLPAPAGPARRARRRRPDTALPDTAGRRAGRRRPAVRHAARLALVVAGGFTLYAYVRSPGAVATPAANARYLSILTPVLPAVLWPLWALTRVLRQRPYRRWLAAGVRAGAAAVIGALLVLGVTATGTAFVVTGPPARHVERAYGELDAALAEAGITEIYADYWICYRLAFRSRERVTCATLSPELGPGFDRYLPYRTRVAGAERPAYVTLVDSPIEYALVDHLRQTRQYVEPARVADFHVYRPQRRLEVPPT